ncbi:phosphotransferase [Cognaticolwellia aestuarii]|uniref:phosphotransferase n=1 Tax=Cognaticolwellia aestuarii TaxID=329993 RepID=UPI0011785695|nr:phosphotransferase [Cognaticolwellia aestuarii]
MSLDHARIMSLGNKHKELAIALCQLPCFNSLTVSNIRVIEAGLSQTCFEVDTAKQRYFAKYIADNYAEVTASELASGYGISPKVLYAGKHWLITEFIAAQGLQQVDLAKNKKITQTLNLLMQCHQIDIGHVQVSQFIASEKNNAAEAERLKPMKGQQVALSTLPVLNIFAVINALIQQLNLSHLQNQQMTQLSEHLQQNLRHILDEQSTDITQVFCHGDANFSNVLIANNGLLSLNNDDCFLVDFECACIAPAEYDLAMMMAVNGIEANKIRKICQDYLRCLGRFKKQNNCSETVENSSVNAIDSVYLSIDLVTRYYEISILINCLWYFVEYQARKQLDYKNLALEQLQLLAQRYPELHNLVLEMR